MALGGVAIALDDLRGKVLGVPVFESYGGRLRSRVKAYAPTMNYIEGENQAEYYPEEATKLVAEGFQALKMCIAVSPSRRTSPPSRRCARPWGRTSN